MIGHRRTLIAIGFAITLGVAAIFWTADERGRPVAPSAGRAAVPTSVPAPSERKTSSTSVAEDLPGGESRLADDLNAPSGTVQRDLSMLNDLFTMWRSNFPQSGNPIGENSDITAALAGMNPLKFAFIPRQHPAINARGELCDRWGTPFRFHQLSGHQMEIRSAGPDRKFGSEDDAVWTPP